MKTQNQEAPKPNLAAFYEQSKRSRAMLQGCTAGDAEAAAHLKKLLSEPCKLLTQALQSAESGDVETLLAFLDNTTELSFVADNIEWLKSIGKYETALLSAYIDTQTNYTNWSLDLLKFLFSIASRPALLAAGETLPGAGPFVVFRGVAGKGAKRRLRGLSWTDDRERAIWFANRYAETGLEKPAVMRAEVMPAQVYAFCDDRNEREFICDIGQAFPIKTEWRAGA